MVVITRSTILPAPPAAVWAAVLRPETLRYVAWPLIRFLPDSLWPETWAEGEFPVRMRLFGLLPLGRHEIVIAIPAAAGDVRCLRDNGHSRLIPVWDHLITVAARPEGTSYTDSVRIEAGRLTGPVAAFARLFYAHRQRRWRRLAHRLR